MTSKQKALRKGRRTRSAVASEFDKLKDGRITLRDVLENPERYSLARCDVWDVLRRAPHLGRVGAKKILLGAKIWPHDKLSELSYADRAEILAWLPPRAR